MKRLATFAILLLAAGPVVAQPAPPASTTPAPNAATPSARNDSAMEARVNQRITQMHERLKITPAQQTAWDGFAQVMRSNVSTTDQAYKERSESIATMSAPDNMRNFAQIEQTRAQGIQNLAAAFQTLYDTMSDDQKKTADAMFRHYEDHASAPRKAPK